MKSLVTRGLFGDAFRRAGRIGRWTEDGLDALYDYLIEGEMDSGDEIELDVIAICCEFAEYPSAAEAAEDLGIETASLDEYEIWNALERECDVVILFDGGVIISAS